MTRSRRSALTLLALLVSACAPSEEPPSEAELEAAALAVHSDSVQAAIAMLTPESFDTITWDGPEAAAERGVVVFNFSCAKCHGPTGAGDGGFVQQGDTLMPPTFLAADWQFADDHEALRRHIWTGTVNGMPHWGHHGLKFRDVDAVGRYINQKLRADFN